MRFKYIIWEIVLIFSLFNFTNAQKSLNIIKNDITNYPNIISYLYLFDDNGNAILNSNSNLFNLRENQAVNNNINSVECSKTLIDTNISINLVFDLALSTFKNNNFQLGQNIARDMIKFLKFREMAITSFDIRTYLNSEFSDTIAKLENEINQLKPQIGSELNFAFFEEPANSFKILSKAKYNKKLILLTDSYTQIDENAIINYATENNINIYILNLSYSNSKALNNIATKTNGLYFDNIQNNKILNIINIIKSHTLGIAPCRLIWNIIEDCVDSNFIELTYPSLSLKDTFTLSVNNNSKSQLINEPQFLSFSSVVIGKTKRLSFSITAKNKDILIKELKLPTEFIIKTIDTTINDTIETKVNDMFIIVDGNVKNYLLRKDEFINVTVEYKAYQEPIIYTELEIISDACISENVLITAGYPNKKPISETIKLIHPNGNEILVIGDTSFVQWKGLLPKDIVQVEYSIDNGRKYSAISNNTEGLKIDWHIPNTPTDSARVKIYQLWPNNIGQTFDLEHKHEVNSAFFDSKGEHILSTCSDGTASVWKVLTKNEVKPSRILLLQGHTNSIIWALFSPNDKYIATASLDSTIKIWSFPDGELIKTLNEHKSKLESVNWSASGKYLASSDFSGEVIIWDTTWNVVKKIKSNFIPTKHVCFDPSDDNMVATANLGSTAKVWNWSTYTQNSKPVIEFDTKAYNNWHITYNNDGTKIAVTTESSKPERLYVWNTADPSKPLYHITHNFDTTSFAILFSSFFKHPELNKELILTAATDNTARLWNAEDGTIFPIIDYVGQNVFGNQSKSHSKSVKTAVFDKNGTRVVTSSLDSLAILWNLNQREIQQDVSDSCFKIVNANGIAKDIDFGDLALGYIKDSLINSVFVNNQNFDYKVNNIKLDGSNASDFSINNLPKLPYILKSGDSINLEMTFKPKDYGARKAQITFDLPSIDITSNLNANVFEQVIKPINPIVDFGKVRVGNFKDTSFNALARNISSNFVNIDSIKFIGSYTDDFIILNGNELKNSPSNSDLPFTLRFNPEFLGRKNAQIEINYKDKGTPTIINLFGEAIDNRLDSIKLYLKDTVAKISDTIYIPIYISFFDNIEIPETIEGFYTNLTFNSTLLEPIGNFETDIISNYYRTIKIKLPKSFDSDSIMAKIPFKVLFGNDSLSILDLKYTYPIGKGYIKINEESSILKIADLCFDNGVRLYDLYGRIELNQNKPNPAIDQTTVSFSIIENGNTTLYITDVLGNQVKTIFDKYMTKGNYEVIIEINELPTGFYNYILKTPTKRIIKNMQIIKN